MRNTALTVDTVMCDQICCILYAGYFSQNLGTELTLSTFLVDAVKFDNPLTN